MSKSDFSITPFRFGVIVLLKGNFWETADSYDEAERDIEEFLQKEAMCWEKI